jgi:rod shape-determining protein MreB and related proteins
VAVISMGGIVTATSVRVGGDELDEAIIAYAKKEYSMVLGERTAEALKQAIGSAFPTPDEMIAEIKGRDLVSGLPKTIHISAEEVRKAIEEPVNAVIDAIKNTLDRCPPELAADLMDQGIILTGGGALLRGLDERLKHETGMPVKVAGDPLYCVVLGSGRCLEEFEAMKRVLVSSGRR